MTWIKIKDDFYLDPKVFALSAEAFRIYVSSIAFSNNQMTDGIVDPRLLSLLPSRSVTDISPFVEELVSAGLWSVSERGHVIANYLTYQRSRAQILQDRADAATRQKRRRRKTSHTCSTVSHAVTMPLREAPASRRCSTVSHGGSHGDVTLPESETESEGSSSSFDASKSRSFPLPAVARENESGNGAFFDQEDPEKKIPDDIREAFARAWAASGNNGAGIPEAYADLAHAVETSIDLTRSKLAEMLAAAKPKARPSQWLKEAVRKAKREANEAAEIAAHQKRLAEAATALNAGDPGLADIPSPQEELGW